MNISVPGSVTLPNEKNSSPSSIATSPPASTIGTTFSTTTSKEPESLAVPSSIVTVTINVPSFV